MVAVACALGGCSASYTVDLTNSTRNSVEATLSEAGLLSGSPVLVRAVVGPGEHRVIGPVSAAWTERVRLSVTPMAGSGGFAERVRLERGLTWVEISDDEYGGSGLSIRARRE